MDIDVHKLRCSTSLADCSLLTLKFGSRLIEGLLHIGVWNDGHVVEFPGFFLIFFY